MVVAERRKSNFESWLVDPHGGKVDRDTASTYLAKINAFQKKILHDDFYLLSIAEIDVLIKERNHGSEIKKYREFLETASAVVIPEETEFIDSTLYMTESLFFSLFIGSAKKNFPGYTMYTKAQARNCKEFSVLLENSAEKKALFVVLLPRSTGEIPKLFQDITADFDALRGLFEKEGRVLSVLVVAGNFEQDFKTACKVIPAIKLARYSLNALELQDAH